MQATRRGDRGAPMLRHPGALRCERPRAAARGGRLRVVRRLGPSIHAEACRGHCESCPICLPDARWATRCCRRTGTVARPQHGATQSATAARSLDEPTEHQARRRDRDERLARLDLALVVLRQPAVPRNPSKRALYYPPARLHLETLGAWLALDDLERPAVTLLLAPVGQLFPRYAASAQIFLSRGTKYARPPSSLRAPTVSGTSAGVRGCFGNAPT